MSTVPYTGFTSSNQPATVTTTPAPTIDATKIGTTTSPVVPAPVTVPTTTYTAPLAAVTASSQASMDAATAQKEADAKAQEALNKTSDISTLQAQLGGKAQDTANTYASTGVNQAYNRLQDINAQLTGINNSNQAIPIQNQMNAQGTAGTQSGVESVNRDQLAQNALKALSLGQEAAIAEGNYNKAKNLADQQVDIKYAQITADIESKKTQLAALKDFVLTPAQEKAKVAQEQALKKQEQEIATKIANEKALTELVTNAAAQGAPQELRDIAALAKTPLEAANILGVYAGDYRKGLLLEEQIKTEKSQQANYRSQINERDNKATPVVYGKDGVVATLPKAAQDRYYKLQGDFDTATKKYRGAIDAAGSVKALSKDATAQDQTAIIFQYMKTLDPDSTVREGEFALVASTAGLGDRAINAFKKLDSGQRLNQTQINDIVGATDKLAQNAQANLSATAKEYDRRASIGGLPQGLFLDEKAAATTTTNPNDSPEAKAVKAKLEAANPTLKDRPFEGTSIIKNISGGKIDFVIPTTKQ